MDITHGICEERCTKEKYSVETMSRRTHLMHHYPEIMLAVVGKVNIKSAQLKNQLAQGTLRMRKLFHRPKKIRQSTNYFMCKDLNPYNDMENVAFVNTQDTGNQVCDANCDFYTQLYPGATELWSLGTAVHMSLSFRRLATAVSHSKYL